jgi:hypothetical protein
MSVLPPTVPSRSNNAASLATDCFRSTGAETLLAKAIGIIVSEASQHLAGEDYTKNDAHSNAPKITA